jgi:hypothetical protein
MNIKKLIDLSDEELESISLITVDNKKVWQLSFESVVIRISNETMDSLME